MKVALDFDGVLSHTMKRWVAVCNLHYADKIGREVSLREVEKWAFFEDFGMTVNEAFAVFDKVWNNWQSLIPMEQDLDQKTKMLSNIAHGELDIVTTVSEASLPNIERWLRAQKVKYRDIVHSKVKHDLDYDVFIDDNPKNVVDMANAGKLVFMYNQPWNRHIDPKEYHNLEHLGEIRRVYNLYHVIDELRMYERVGRFD